jgi:hypothetical protein
MKLFLLSFCGFLVSSPLHVSGIEPVRPETMAFFGRWDMRTPGRAITVNSGSYVKACFNGPAVTALFDVSLNKDPFPTLAWKIDDGAWHEDDVAATVLLADRLAPGPHSLWLMVRSLDEHQSRWKQPIVASVTFYGLDLPDGKLLAPLDVWIHPKLKMEFLGDSITEGVLVGGGRKGATWPWLSNARLSYAAQTAMILGAEWRQVGFGLTTINAGPGDGGAPAALDSFNFFYDGCPRDDWQPDIVVVNQGANNKGESPQEYQPFYIKYLTLIRSAYPHARIVAVRPFSGAQEIAVKQSVDTVRAAGDLNVFYIDTTGWYKEPYPGAVHPSFTDSAPIAAKLSAAIQNLK